MCPSQGLASSEAIHLPASLVSSQAPHQQAVTYFHAFILPSSCTGLMSLQTACTGTAGDRQCPTTSIWHNSLVPGADWQLLPSSYIWCRGDVWSHLSSRPSGCLSLLLLPFPAASWAFYITAPRISPSLRT